MVLIMGTIDVSLTCRKSDHDGLSRTILNCLILEFSEYISFATEVPNEESTLCIVKTDSSTEVTKAVERDRGQFRLVVVAVEAIVKEFRSSIVSKSSMSEMVYVEQDEMVLTDFNQEYQKRLGMHLQRLNLSIENEALLETFGGNVLLDIINLENRNNVRLVKRTLKEDKSYHLPRSLTSRSTVSKRLFEARPSEIFVFSGVKELVELSHFVRNWTIAHSTAPVKSCSHLILDNANDFDVICEKYKQTVNWINVEGNGMLKWYKSSKQSNAMNESVMLTESIPNERTFCERIDEASRNSFNGPILIGGCSGIGKSFLLNKIGLILEQLHPNRSIIFLTARSFAAEMQKNVQYTNEDTKVMEALINLSCGSHLGKVFLERQLFSPTTKIELLLDGYDEVALSRESQSNIDSWLRCIQRFKSVRLWVTTRTQYSEHLEKICFVPGYAVLPFTQVEQENALALFWNQGSISNIERLREFAGQCLKAHSKLKSIDGDFTGIPLMCFMLAKLKRDDALNYAARCNPLHSMAHFGSTLDLYKKLIDKEIEKFKLQNGPGFRNYLVQISLKVYFPDFFYLLSQLIDPTKGISDVDMKNILDQGSPLAMYNCGHKTIAEFILAEAIANRLNQPEEWSEKLCSFFVHAILKTFEREFTIISGVEKQETAIKTFEFNYAIPQFLSEMIHYNDIGIQRKIVTACGKQMSALKLKKLFHASLHLHEEWLFNFLEKCIFYVENSNPGKLFDLEFVLIACQVSNLSIFKLALRRFRKHKELCRETVAKLLQVAVIRGESYIVQYLLKEKETYVEPKLTDNNHFSKIISNENLAPWLMHQCAAYSHERLKGTISHKKEIINQLLHIDMDGKLVKRCDDRGRTPILSFNIHSEIMLHLIDKNVDILAKDNNNDTILHVVAGRRHLNADEYCELVKRIPLQERKILVKSVNNKGDSPLGTLVKEIIPTPETLELFKEVGADFSHYNKKKWSILAIAIDNGAPLEILEKLTKCGANILAKDREGNTILHTPCKLPQRYHNLVKCIPQDVIKQLVNVPNADGDTPICLLLKNYANPVLATFDEFSISKETFNFVNKEGYSVLAIAIRKNCKKETLKKLISCGAKANWKKRNMAGRKNLLHIAAKYENCEAAHFLVTEYGCKVDEKTCGCRGTTPLEYAQKHGVKSEIYNVLKRLQKKAK